MEKLMIKNVLNKFGSVRVALVAAAGLPLIFASNAVAQAPPPPPGETFTGETPTGAGTEAVAERVIVTGSNIPTAQEQASIPVTTYTAQWLQKSGSNTPVEGLRQLPTFVGNAETENDSNGGDGTAFINLRGLGAENTLVLINGRRMAGGNGIAADVNLIPLSPVMKVDVLKDGASAIYGSDAVAGVINFQMWNDIRDYGPIYEGAEFELRYGTTTDHDANLRQAWVRGGVTGMDGKVAIFAAAEYYNRAALFSADRDISITGDLSSGPIGDNPPVGAAGLGLGGINNNSPTYAGAITTISLGGSRYFDRFNKQCADSGQLPAIPGKRRSVPVQLPRVYAGDSGNGKVDDLRDWAIQDIWRCSPDLRRHVVHARKTEERSGGISFCRWRRGSGLLTLQPISRRRCLTGEVSPPTGVG